MRTMGWLAVTGGVALILGCGGGGHHGNSDDSASRANLRKLYTAAVTYSNDSDGVLPLADWSEAILPYGGLDQTYFHRPGTPVGAYGYALNSAALGLATSFVASPDGLPTFFESTTLTRDATAAYPATGLKRNGGVLTIYLSSRLAPASRVAPTTEQLRATGLSNVKRLALGLIVYSADNDDKLPQSAWTDTVTPYLGLGRELIKSPSLPAGEFGYAFDQDLLGVTTTSLDTPASVPMVFDSNLTARNAVSAYAPADPPRPGGDNVAYADGHGATLP